MRSEDRNHQPAFVLRLFGTIRLDGPNGTLSRFPTKRSALILARVALARDQRLGRDELAELLWPDEYLDRSRVRLRQELLRLRQAIGELGNHLQADRQWLEIDPGVLDLDVRQFDSTVSLASSSKDAAETCALLARAGSLYSAPLLAGFQEPWILGIRESYRDRALALWLELAERLEGIGDRGRSLEAAYHAVGIDPLHPVANEKLLARLVDRGEIARAKLALEHLDDRMKRELGERAPDSLRAIVEPRVQLPENGSADGAQETRIPRPLPLFGREALLASLEIHLARPGAAIVLVGPAGIGKTHVREELAWRASQGDRHGVQFGGEPQPTSDGLCVIDSRLPAEELIGAVRAASRAGWRVLAESRRRLRFDGCEQVAVSSLPIPRPGEVGEALLTNPSVQLMLSRVDRHEFDQSHPALYSAICQLAGECGGHPALLRDLSERLLYASPEQVLTSFEGVLNDYVEQSNLNGESVKTAVVSAIEDLSDSAIQVLSALALMDGASADLLATIAIQGEFARVVQQLEERSLITSDGFGVDRRLRTPRPVAAALLGLLDLDNRRELEQRTWQVLAEWVYCRSRRLTGNEQGAIYSSIAAEMDNIRRATRWGLENDPSLAAYLVVGSWRTVSARGRPLVDVDLLFQAAVSGANHLEPSLAGEALTGCGILFSVCSRFSGAEEAFRQAISILDAEGGEACTDKAAWARLNYASDCLIHFDRPRALETAREAVNQAVSPELKLHAQTDYVLMLAESGNVEESIRIGEATFAKRLELVDPTMNARAYADLGELYLAVGRREAGRPLVVEGIRGLREAGVQYMLSHQLVYLAKTVASDTEVDWRLLAELLDEAEPLTDEIGNPSRQLEVARLRMILAAGIGDAASFECAVERTFKLTHTMQRVGALDASLRVLAASLDRLDAVGHANAVRRALGDSPDGPTHSGWATLLATDSLSTACALATVMAREAMAESRSCANPLMNGPVLIS